MTIVIMTVDDVVEGVLKFLTPQTQQQDGFWLPAGLVILWIRSYYSLYAAM